MSKSLMMASMPRSLNMRHVSLAACKYFYSSQSSNTPDNLPVESDLCIRIMIEPSNQAFDNLRNTIETAEDQVEASISLLSCGNFAHPRDLSDERDDGDHEATKGNGTEGICHATAEGTPGCVSGHSAWCIETVPLVSLRYMTKRIRNRNQKYRRLWCE
jgi:hypothetical protein